MLGRKALLGIGQSKGLLGNSVLAGRLDRVVLTGVVERGVDPVHRYDGREKCIGQSQLTDVNAITT